MTFYEDNIKGRFLSLVCILLLGLTIFLYKDYGRYETVYDPHTANSAFVLDRHTGQLCFVGVVGSDKSASIIRACKGWSGTRYF